MGYLGSLSRLTQEAPCPEEAVEGGAAFLPCSSDWDLSPWEAIGGGEVPGGIDWRVTKGLGVTGRKSEAPSLAGEGQAMGSVPGHSWQGHWTASFHMGL